MITYNYAGNEQKIFYEKLENGLEVYIVPNRQKKTYHLELGVKYGSEITRFKGDGEKDYTELPDGIAHYLEHKVFDMEDGDGIKIFAKLGSSANAGTSYYLTRYYVEGERNFKKNLENLLSIVLTPYFTPETVLKERDIISEEIKMYDDEPEWIFDDALKKALYQKMLTKKIAGTVESIQDIDSQLLQKVYDHFYQPGNMFLIITGNVKYQEVLNIVKNNSNLKKKKERAFYYELPKEPKEVNKEYLVLRENILVPKVAYHFKFDLSEMDFIDKRLIRLYYNAVLTILFGDASTFNLHVLENNLASFFYLEYASYNNIYDFSLNAESEYADLFKDEVDKTITNIHITEEDLIRTKKVWLSHLVRSLDNPTAITESIVDDIVTYHEYSDEMALIKEINYQDLLKVFQKMDFSNNVFALMLPK